jgi:hypothetical protein
MHDQNNLVAYGFFAGASAAKTNPNMKKVIAAVPRSDLSYATQSALAFITP